MSFVRRVALTSLAPLLLLGACAEDKPDPPAAEPTSSPPSVTASAAEPSASAEPTLPPEAEGTGPEAAEAFVRHYFAVANYAQASGDARGLRSLGTDKCIACQRSAQAVEDIYKRGGQVVGGDATVDDVRVTNPQNGSRPQSTWVEATVTNAEQTVSGSGKLDGTYPAATVRMYFELIPVGDRFRVTQWGQK
ncbi:DUF6318 family protein [Nocardioides piscis]|uniref:DUF6318 family protein n=1 Tax=Nocardioides piscis TaxID=2714938 RepID=UPI003CCDD99B